MHLAIVEWVDSNVITGWHHKDSDASISNCVTVGILRRENAKEVEMVLNFSQWSKAEVIAIPKVSIKRIRRLKVEK